MPSFKLMISLQKVHETSVKFQLGRLQICIFVVWLGQLPLISCCLPPVSCTHLPLFRRRVSKTARNRLAVSLAAQHHDKSSHQSKFGSGVSHDLYWLLQLVSVEGDAYSNTLEEFKMSV